MFESSYIMGILLALGSAAIWGTGDFTGGEAARRLSQFQVLVISSISGLAILVVIAFFSGEAIPSKDSLFWAVTAGAMGGMGLAALYKGLSEGSAAVVAPTAAVVGASIPVLVGFLIDGLLEPTKIGGMFLALLGIWFVSREPRGGNGEGRQSVITGAVAGCGFAGFLIMIAFVDSETMMTSLTAARLSTLVVALAMCFRAGKRIPKLGVSKLAIYAGIADVTGNILYVSAQQYIRLDVAAVLSSLYPATTVLMAWMILKQRIAGPQWFGLLCCLGGVALIVT